MVVFLFYFSLWGKGRMDESEEEISGCGFLSFQRLIGWVGLVGWGWMVEHFRVYGGRVCRFRGIGMVYGLMDAIEVRWNGLQQL